MAVLSDGDAGRQDRRASGLLGLGGELPIQAQMSPELDGPESERWIEPFASYLTEQCALPRVSFEHVRGLLPQMDLRIGALAVLRGDMSARDVYRVLASGQEREALFGQLAVELGIL